MNNEDAQTVFDAIGPLSRISAEKGYVPEEDFEYILWGTDADNCPEKISGMHLNDMSTSRQRSMIMNAPSYVSALEERRNSTSVSIQDISCTDDHITKKPRRILCSNPNCKAVFDEQLKLRWTKCKSGAKGCRKIFVIKLHVF